MRALNYIKLALRQGNLERGLTLGKNECFQIKSKG
jgi:hypothetical protein